MKNKTILITGASSGLGQKLATILSNEGAQLSLFSRNQMPIGSSLAIRGDVQNPEDCKNAVIQTIEKFGSLDCIILNAGVSMWARFDQIQDPLIFKSMIDTNYLGAVYFTYYALPHLIRSKGLIVPISSIQGKLPVPFHTGYSASKHAIDGFFSTLRSENLVDILLVSPSWIQGTGIHRRALVRHKRDDSQRGLDLDDCAQKIVHAMKKRKKELFLPKYYKMIPLIKSLFPRLLDKLVYFALKKHALNKHGV